jgi:glycosyltransferase involved in cell wall biosynthesis
MRITFVIPNDGMTGGIRVVAIYADKLAKRGHQVVVVAPGTRRLTFRRKLRSFIAGRGWPKMPDPEPSYFDGLVVKVRKLDAPRPILDSDVPDADVVVATWWETAEWVSALSSRKGAKAYFIQHHEVFSHLPVERSKATYRLPLKKLVISRWLEQIMVEQYGDHDVSLIPNSVDTEQFFATDRGKQSTPTVGFVYSKVNFKGSDIILDALNMMRARMPKLRVVAFGAEQVSPDLVLPNWVSYHYRPSQDQIRRLYGECDVWLCGSRSEGFYLPMLEAMACRCPVVSTRVGGPIDIIRDSENGFLVDVEDSNALAKFALKVLELDEEKWREMSKAALSTATQYTWDDAANRLERIFEQLTPRVQAASPGLKL